MPRKLGQSSRPKRWTRRVAPSLSTAARRRPWRATVVVVVIDEAHAFFHERKGTSPEVKAHNALVAELSRLVEELIRKGRNVAIQVMLLMQRATGDAIPTGSATTARWRSPCDPDGRWGGGRVGEEIRRHPEVSPVLLNDPAYVGVAVMSLPGRLEFHRVRTPQGGSPPGRRHHPR
jgi:S-DNA-T family DNA segregation ATPase FtsK/SpoIIIE